MKISKGKWETKYDPEFTKNMDFPYIVLTPSQGAIHPNVIASAISKTNAQLIAEAGNVTNECGFTPRQLLEQRDELKAACKVAKKSMLECFEKQAEKKAIDCEFGVSEWESFMPKEYHVLTQAIQKTEVQP